LGVARDDCVLVTRDDVSGHAAARGADARSVQVVRGFIQLKTYPSATATDRGSDRRGVLTNTRGENDSVQSAKRSG